MQPRGGCRPCPGDQKHWLPLGLCSASASSGGPDGRSRASPSSLASGARLPCPDVKLPRLPGGRVWLRSCTKTHSGPASCAPGPMSLRFLYARRAGSPALRAPTDRTTGSTPSAVHISAAHPRGDGADGLVAFLAKGDAVDLRVPSHRVQAVSLITAKNGDVRLPSAGGATVGCRGTTLRQCSRACGCRPGPMRARLAIDLSRPFRARPRTLSAALLVPRR
jgi:hypothetical protein